MGAGDLTLKAGDSFSSNPAVSGNVSIEAGYNLLQPGLTNSSINFRTDNTERMRIDASGNLGLGVTPSAWVAFRAFEVGAGSINSIASSELNINQNSYYGSSNWTYKANGGATMFRSTGSDFRWFNAPSGTAGNAITFTQAMTLNSAGNLGIGTASPATRLDVDYSSGMARFGSGSGNNLLQLNSAQSMGLWAGGENRIYSTSGFKFAINASVSTATPTGYTDAVTITDAGNLLVGATSTTMGQTGIIMQPAAGGNVGNIDIGHANAAGGGNSYVRFYHNAGVIGSITQDGTTAVLYNTTSDARLKENVAPADDAAALIDAIQVRKFDWKSDGSHQRYGFVAQELVEVAPEAVQVPQDEDEMMGVDYSKLVPMLVKEIQSLRARVAQLEGN
jgi:hypothetical protein